MTEPPPTSSDDPLPTPTPDEVARHRAWWVTALVDGGYVQGTGALRVDRGDEPRFCCLGVAEDLRRGRDAWCPATRPGLDHVGSHDLPDVADALDDVEGREFRQGVALTKATQAWLGLRADDPSVTVRAVEHDELDREWTTTTLSGLNDDRRLSLVKIAAVLADQPADWDGDPVTAVRETLRRQREVGS